MALRAGPAGFAVTDVHGQKVRHVYNIAMRLMRHGLLFSGKVGHRTMRLFAKREWAAAFEATRKPRPTQDAGAHSKRFKACWDADTPAIYPVDANGNPLYKITQCPSHFDPAEAQNRNRSRWNADAPSPRF